MDSWITNEEIARTLDRIADLLDVQGANTFRVQAYRRAALRARTCGEPIAEAEGDGGDAAVQSLLGIGPSLRSLIHELLHTGRIRMLARLEGNVSPEELFMTVPGIGEALARQLHARLGVETLEELEVAANDGRLQRVKGFGARRTRMVREELAALLARRRRRTAGRAAAPAPPITLLLELDETYRRLAAEGKLKTISPRRFNPAQVPWLPVLHVDRDGWSFTALYSNTARAHALGTVHDWVVIYFDRDGHEGQYTVVTETRGPGAGLRVVRGRETESVAHQRPPPPIQETLAL